MWWPGDRRVSEQAVEKRCNDALTNQPAKGEGEGKAETEPTRRKEDTRQKETLRPSVPLPDTRSVAAPAQLHVDGELPRLCCCAVT